MNILGVSCYFHDAGAALIQNGRLIACVEEERFSRMKHDFRFPHYSIQFCLKSAGIPSSALDYVVFFEKPFRKFERILMTNLQMFPKSYRLFQESIPAWLGDKLWIQKTLSEYLGKNLSNHLGFDESRILFVDHHSSHAASAFFCSPYKEAAILTVDGVGEWTTACVAHGKDNKIKICKEIRFPHSLGLLYSAFTAFLGFEVNEGEYKVMGMAPFGKPRYVEEVYKTIQVDPNGGFRLNMDYFCFHYSTEKTFTKKFEKLFGPPRNPESQFFTESTGFPSYFGERPAGYEQQLMINQKYADLAASIQVVTEEILVKMAAFAYRETGCKQLCMAGGVALNSVANSRILQETAFEELYIQPAAGDGGAALGAALYAQHAILNQPRTFVMEHAYWGEEHSTEIVETFLQSKSIHYRRVNQESELLKLVAQFLEDGKVIGWHQGRFEFGPRALGNRSILADPRRADMKDKVNLKIKFREPFRPFAPSVLVNHVEDYFDLPEASRHYPARFMLYVVDVKQDKQTVLPAITHVDGTGRLQAVRKETNPRYAGLIETFGNSTGVPVVLNTSFNLRGEPVVNTPAEAYSTFERSGLDVLVLGDCIVQKEI